MPAFARRLPPPRADLAASDPAVAAGLMATEVHPFRVVFPAS